jgi:RimJ/RimL family protein N-acetyltransferase
MLQLAHPVEHVFQNQVAHHQLYPEQQPAESADVGEERLWEIPLTRTVATTGEGVGKLGVFIDQHRAYLKNGGGWSRREKYRLQSELDSLLQAPLVSRWRVSIPKEKYISTLEQVMQRQVSPWQAVKYLFWFENMLNAPEEERPLVIEVKEENSWVPLGNCGLHNIDWRNRSADAGIFIGEVNRWNQGYGTEAMQLLLAHGFETLNLHRIALRVYENNPGAIRSYEKVGFTVEGHQRQAEFQSGEYLDVILMSVLRSEWTTK